MTERLQPDVLLLADGPTGFTALRSWAAQRRVVQVFRKPDHPEASALRAFAKTQGISVTELQELNQLRKAIPDLRPAAVVISSFDRIISRQILALCRFVKVPYSLLPHYHGVNWAIINGETTAGISMHLVIPALAGGNLLFQQAIALGSNDTVACLYNRLNAVRERELGGVVLRVVPGYQGTGQKNRSGLLRLHPRAGRWRDCLATADRRHCGSSSPALRRGLMLPLISAAAGPDRGPVTLRRLGGCADRRRCLRVSSVLIANSERPCAAAFVIGSTRATLELSRLDLLRRIVALEDRLASLKQLKCTQD
ncbi:MULTISPECIES: formyltransferase family protein [unclassified Bradyrhizobium]|jgi:folate-dependent phosphoribosylglycinamide formyltransferase PurN|uniref:formyltransferase family protein n=1 Tax=unclassified Bradyrhizobium TaxID=2631580 RepID=UPI001FFBA8E0|nr:MULTISPECIES: formyltransferase family protein [unclassified Bradyrhizobium]MCK1521843.1 hypothetical protein [Bradyrhizobium sp. 17]MCK1688023.1 hypothetical protein [Bradyrhizobium sp. 145]